MITECQPEWVLADGELHHVSDFAYLEPQERPHVICPVCKDTVILKLGKIRAYHFAHKPDVECAYTISETALHYNTKFYIYTQLKSASEIRVMQKCNTYHCQHFHIPRWISGWDDVQVEYTVDSYRPDIALIREGQVIGAIEVFVTNAVKLDKALFYDTNFIRWIEVQGAEDFYQGDTKWTFDQPLPYTNMSKEIPDWVCENCQKAKAEAEARARAMEEAEEARWQEAIARQKEAKARAEYEANFYPLCFNRGMSVSHRVKQNMLFSFLMSANYWGIYL